MIRLLFLMMTTFIINIISTFAEAQQNWPTRPVKIIIPYAAPAPVDSALRILVEPLTKHFGQNFLIENRPGAGGNIGSDYVAKAAPDGYTLLLNSTAIVTSLVYNKKMSYNVEKDLTPISLMLTGDTVLGASNKFQPNNVPELIKLAKTNPGKITFGSSGTGTTNHLSGELLKFQTGIDLLHIPFSGSAQALISIMGGQTDLMFGSALDLAPRAKAGQIKALGVTNAQRSSALPDVSTIGEYVPGYESTVWYGLFGPAGISPDITNKLSLEMGALANVLDIKTRLESLNATFIGSRPDVLAKLVRDEIVKWRRVVQQAGLAGD